MSRALLNDPDVGRRIREEFIPASGGIERLQPDRYGWNETASSRWFVAMAKEAFANFAPKGFWEEFGSYQGLYVVGPDGTPYAYRVVWQLPPAELLKTLDEAEKAYQEHPPGKVRLDEKSIAEEAPGATDPSTSVLRVCSRVRDGSSPGIGRDQMWIFRDEVEELIRAGDSPGVEVPLPRPIVARLVRFQLLDNTRNIGMPFGESDVRKAEFVMTAFRTAEGRRSYSFRGAYSSERHDEENDEQVGVEGILEGEVEVDLAKSRIVRFRAYGEAQAWGDVKRTGAPAGKYPLLIAIVEADDAIARSVPPVWYGLSPIWSPIYTHPNIK